VSLAKLDNCAYWLNCDVVHSYVCIKCIEYLCYLQGDWHSNCFSALMIVIVAVAFYFIVALLPCLQHLICSVYFCFSAVVH